MKYAFGILTFFASIMFFGCLPAYAQLREQTSFGIETEIRKPHRIPKYVVRQIVQNEETFSASETEDLSKRLESSLINLNNDRQPDLFVQGDNGANITGFWLFRNINGRWKLVLYSRAAWLTVKKTMSKGFRNIEINAASAVRMWGASYEFNGTRYVPKRCWEEMENGKKVSRKYFQCSGSSIKPYV